MAQWKFDELQQIIPKVLNLILLQIFEKHANRLMIWYAMAHTVNCVKKCVENLHL